MPALHTVTTFRRLPMLIFIAWRNIWRNPVRSALTISALAGGLVMVILYASLLKGMTGQMVRFTTEVSTGHLQIHRQAYIDDQDMYATLPWSYLEDFTDNFPSIDVAPRLYAAGLASTAKTSTGVLIKAVDLRRETAVTQMLSHVRQGRTDLGTIDPDEENPRHFSTVVGYKLAKNMNLQPGSELILVTQAADGSIGNAIFHVSAILKPLEPAFDRMGVMISIKAYQQLMSQQDGFHELAIRVEDLSQLPAFQTEIEKELSVLAAMQPLDKWGGKAVVRNWRQLTPAISDMLNLSKTILLVVGVIIVGLASLGMLNTMLMAIHERSHEFGILLAVGMKRRWLLLMVLLESFFLALVSSVIGAAIGTLIAGYFERHGIDFSRSMPDGYDWAGMVFEPVMRADLELTQIGYACLLMLSVSLLASLIPAWRIVRFKPAEVMR